MYNLDLILLSRVILSELGIPEVSWIGQYMRECKDFTVLFDAWELFLRIYFTLCNPQRIVLLYISLGLHEVIFNPPGLWLSYLLLLTNQKKVQFPQGELNPSPLDKTCMLYHDLKDWCASSLAYAEVGPHLQFNISSKKFPHTALFCYFDLLLTLYNMQ